MIGSAFLINAMIDFIILVLLFYIISILNKKDISMRNKFSILSFFYFISLILNIALLSGKLTAVSSEILLIESFFMIGKTFVFVLIFSEILKNKKLMY